MTKKQRTKHCIHCNEEFAKKVNESKKRWAEKKFCSRDCHYDHQRKERVEKGCPMCGDTFEVYKEKGQEIGALVDEKNQAYGDSFDKSQDMLKILYPDGIKTGDYKDVLLLARIFDKMMRIANKEKAFDENPYKDIAGYGILGTGLDD